MFQLTLIDAVPFWVMLQILQLCHTSYMRTTLKITVCYYFIYSRSYPHISFRKLKERSWPGIQPIGFPRAKVTEYENVGETLAAHVTPSSSRLISIAQLRPVKIGQATPNISPNLYEAATVQSVPHANGIQWIYCVVRNVRMALTKQSHSLCDYVCLAGYCNSTEGLLGLLLDGVARSSL